MIDREYLENSLKAVSTEVESIVARFNALKGQEAVFKELVEMLAPQASDVIDGAYVVVVGVC
jgi:hypothetical protein